MKFDSCRRRVWAVLARCHPVLIAVCCLTPFMGLLLPDGRVIPENGWIHCDYATYQLPVRRFARDELLAGRFPLWVPHLACGLPLHAGMQASLFHPIVMPLVLCCGADYGTKLALFAHLALGFVGMYRLARAYAVSRPSSSLAAVLTTWSGFGLGHLMAGHVTIMIQYALVPWFFLALTALSRRPGVLPAVGLAAVTACLAVSGHPQIFYYTLVFGGLWFAGSMVGGATSRHRARCIGAGVEAVVIGLLLASVQLAPTMELVRDGFHGSKRDTTKHAAEYCLDGVDIARFFLPNLVGNPFTGPPPHDASDHYHEQVVYFGWLGPLLALFGMTRVGASRWQLGCACLLLLAFAIALGRSTPVFDLLVETMPGLHLFRCHGRVFCVASVFLALLAARGLDLLVSSATTGGPQLTALAAILFGAAVLSVCAILSLEPETVQSQFAYLKRHGQSDIPISAMIGLDVCAVLAVGIRCGASRPGAAHAIAIVLTLLDLGYFNVRNFQLTALEEVTIPERLLNVVPPLRFVDTTESPRFGHAPLQYSRLVPRAIAAKRTLVGTNEGGVLPGATEELFRTIEARPDVALPLAACGYGCAPTTGDWTTLRPPLPRVRFVVRNGAALLAVPIDLLLADDVETLRDADCGDVTIVGENPRQVTIEVGAPSGGYLAMADTWYPGWKCWVDGKECAIGRAHSVFRCVAIDEGRHRVVFAFEPRSFRIGAVASLCGVGLTIGLLCYLWAPLRRAAGIGKDDATEVNP